MTYRMIVKTDQPSGRTQTETTRHLTEAQLPQARETARQGAPRGGTRTIRVVAER